MHIIKPTENIANNRHFRYYNIVPAERQFRRSCSVQEILSIARVSVNILRNKKLTKYFYLVSLQHFMTDSNNRSAGHERFNFSFPRAGIRKSAYSFLKKQAAAHAIARIKQPLVRFPLSISEDDCCRDRESYIGNWKDLATMKNIYIHTQDEDLEIARQILTSSRA